MAGPSIVAPTFFHCPPVAARGAALKMVQAGQNLAQAGLVEVRQGEGHERLRSIEEPSDLLRDGWKDFFWPLLKSLEPKLASGAVIDVDDLNTFPGRSTFPRFHIQQ